MFPVTANSTRRLSTSREGHLVENALHTVLFNENIWAHAFAASNERRRSGKGTGRQTRWNALSAYIQFAYEKSRVHYVLPVLVLVAYSLLGGLIFYSIEAPPERILIQQKARFISNERDALLLVVDEIQRRVAAIQTFHLNDTFRLKIHVRAYRKFALNQLHKRVYWYALSAYYLSEQETNKAQALRPRSPESAWRPLMQSNIGRIHALQNYTEQLALRCWEIGLERGAVNETRSQVDEALERFNTLTGLHNVLAPVWTFWNAMLLAVTTYTTIGYGNVTAKTRLGQLAAMLYAVIGIPLVLMILHKLGRLSLSVLANVWQRLCRLANSLLSSASSSAGSRLSPEAAPELASPAEEIPLLVAIGVAFGWMFLCAAIYLRFEDDWDYFKSFYFFFCSLTTIGYGDVTPTNSEDMFLIFGLVMVGLSLVSMCINLKLEKLFEELLLSLMEEYNADPEARELAGDKIGILDMWRVWKKRKNRLREQAAAGRAVAGEHIARVNPFSRRRERRQLLKEIRLRLSQMNKATQTERVFTACVACDPIFAPPDSLYLAPAGSGLSKLPLPRLLLPQRARPESVSPFISSPSPPFASPSSTASTSTTSAPSFTSSPPSSRRLPSPSSSRCLFSPISSRPPSARPPSPPPLAASSSSSSSSFHSFSSHSSPMNSRAKSRQRRTAFADSRSSSFSVRGHFKFPFRFISMYIHAYVQSRPTLWGHECIEYL